MKDEIKEIIDRLERIDHKEYSVGFEFADSATFNEMARCFEERKKMSDYITNLQEGNKELGRYYTRANNEFLELNKRIKKAIEYIEKDILNEKIEKVDWNFDDCYFSDMPAERIKPLIDILQGVGKDEL